MHEPYLALYVQNNALRFEKKLPTEEVSREIFEVPLSQVISEPLDEAGRRLGTTVLGLLRLWHKQEFAEWDKLHNSGPAAVDDFVVALYLIDRLSQGASEDRLRLIDEILGQASTSCEAASNYLQKDWPTLRKRLLRETSK
ncbi:MAG: hypothetical protein LBI92_02455 [Azoarcus sp.]|jgi:hypothetical protein|nr:hypothetical protein [Azoarcus sp.]